MLVEETVGESARFDGRQSKPKDEADVVSYSHRHEVDIASSAASGLAMEVEAARLWRNCAMGLLK